MPSQAVFGLLQLQQTRWPSNGLWFASDNNQSWWWQFFFLDPEVLKRWILPLCVFSFVSHILQILTLKLQQEVGVISIWVCTDHLLQTVWHMSHAAHAGFLAAPKVKVRIWCQRWPSWSYLSQKSKKKLLALKWTHSFPVMVPLLHHQLPTGELTSTLAQQLK